MTTNHKVVTAASLRLDFAGRILDIYEDKADKGAWFWMVQLKRGWKWPDSPEPMKDRWNWFPNLEDAKLWLNECEYED